MKWTLHIKNEEEEKKNEHFLMKKVVPILYRYEYGCEYSYVNSTFITPTGGMAGLYGRFVSLACQESAESSSKVVPFNAPTNNI